MQQTKEYVIKLLAKREYSEKELRQKMSLRAVPQEQIEDVLAWLIAEGLQSDTRFLEAYQQSRVSRGFGPLQIIAGLRERGIAGALIEDHIHVSEAQWKQLAQAACQKKFGNELPENQADRAKQARFLQQRGFTMEHIQSVWKKT